MRARAQIRTCDARWCRHIECEMGGPFEVDLDTVILTGWSRDDFTGYEAGQRGARPLRRPRVRRR